MILSAHQPAFLPWPGYLHRIAISDKFVLLDDVQFEKNSFTNRNRIKGADGKPQWITVPLNMKKHISSKIYSMKVVPDRTWKKKHIKAIENLYSKAPFFSEHISFLRDSYNREWSNLVDLNHHFLQYLLEKFEINTPVVFQSSLETKESKQNLILELCEIFKAEHFIFGSFGRNYVDPELFEEHNVKVFFHEYCTPKYSQIRGDFVENLSALDILFNIEPNQRKELLFLGGKLGS